MAEHLTKQDFLDKVFDFEMTKNGISKVIFPVL